MKVTWSYWTCQAAPGHEESPPGVGPGGRRGEINPGGQSQNGGGGPPAQLEATGAAQATKEEPGPEGGGRNHGAGKGQRKIGRGDGQGSGPTVEGGGSCGACRNAPKSGAAEMLAEQGHPAGPVGQEGGAGRKNKEDDGTTGVAKPEVAAGEATHPAGAPGEGRGSGAMDTRSMGVAGPHGEAKDGEAGILSGEDAS
ncbi:uncharacterized protein Dana_GF27823 [Drosophila ananassae]|uniref:Uncharacterized protein n=1 Tax=Drosophila ananassae TaxID=7217 RepID=A0A0P8YL81_DROAN|nr:uncharacterized protein Dana_GF27823 [Drosophila ananassae]